MSSTTVASGAGEVLANLVRTKRVIVTVGAGGVGKTTTSAAMSLAAAREGRRVLCLTIDPAKRLADSLGIGAMRHEAVDVPKERFVEADIPLRGSLTAMMLDTKRTFDEIIVRYSSSREKADALLSNKLYQYVSGSLAGTQEYMAMEKLMAVKSDERYDLIVLDTPPTANALDFLDAPERMIDALDSPATRWLVEAFQSSGKLSFNILAKSASTVLKTLSKITGGNFLEEMAALIVELNELFGGFRERARNVQQSLREADTAFVLVASPSPPSLKEAVYFSERLEEYHMPRGAFVINRFRRPPPFGTESIGRDAAEGAVAARSITVDEDLPERLVQAHQDAVKLAALDAHFVQKATGSMQRGVPVVRVPELASDVHDLRHLACVADLLMSGGI